MATSGAGGAWARRRRDLSPSLRSLCKLLLFFSFFLLSFISIKPSLLLPFFKVSQIRDREWIWLPASPLPVSPDDAVAQIWGLYRSGKQTKPDPALRPSSRYKSTKNHSKPVAPCPLESSTVHGDALNKAESSCVTKAATLGSFLSSQKYWFNHSTKMEVFPAALHPNLLHSATNPSPTPEKELAKPPSELPSILSEQSTALLPIWSTCPAPLLRRRRLESFKTLIAMGSSLSLVLGPIHVQPLIFQHRPISRILGPTTLSIRQSRPRSDFIPSLSPNINLVCLQGSISRGLCPEATIWIWRSENLSRNLLSHWKKILAQPKETTTSHPSRQALVSIISEKPPLHLKGVFEDIIHFATSFQSLSFKVIPRLENTLEDDFSKNAIRSMTSGYSPVL